MRYRWTDDMDVHGLKRFNRLHYPSMYSGFGLRLDQGPCPSLHLLLVGSLYKSNAASGNFFNLSNFLQYFYLIFIGYILFYIEI